MSVGIRFRIPHSLFLIPGSSFLLLLLCLASPSLSTPILSSSDLDAALSSTWSAARLTPTTSAPPATFLRRLHLDLTGTTPPPSTVRAYLTDPTSSHRDRLIAQLLTAPEFAAHWSRRLTRALLSPRADAATSTALQQHLTDRLSANATWPAIAKSLISSTPFRAQFADAPQEIAGQLGSGVLGMRLRCAQCHDDPLNRWTVADYYGLAAFFGNPRKISVPGKLYDEWRAGRVHTFYDVVANVPDMRPRGPDHRWVRRTIEGYMSALRELARLTGARAEVPDVTGLDWAAYDVYRIHAQRRAAKKDGGTGRMTAVLSDRDEGDLKMPPLPVSPLNASGAPEKGKPVPPRWPNDASRPPPASARREALAAWMGDPANPLVARAIVNRVWAELMGRGLVEPVDEVCRPQRDTHSGMLDRLAEGFRRRGGDLRWLIATIVSSRAYALSCAAGAAPRRPRPRTRPHHGVEIEVGAPGSAPVAEEQFAVRTARPLGTAEVAFALRRATGQLDAAPRPELAKALARVFDPMEVEETSPSGGLPRGLFFLTGAELQRLVDGAPILEPRRAELLEDLFLNALARPPTAAEAARLEPALATRKGAADVLWALISSAEFLTNH
jgi:hypothetical protein